MPLTKIPVKTQDGEHLQIDVAVIKFSDVLSDMIEHTNVNIHENDTMEEINFECTAIAAKKVEEWCIFNTGGGHTPEDVKAFEKTLVDVHVDIIWDLILAGEFLGIKRFIEITCDKARVEMEGLSTEELRSKFSIENDFDADEYQNILDQNKWTQC
uniref:Skp1-related protein n=1 Tax=Rhabditophanes sp. KR3021 TaxID=114890 RepID=A0AC35TG68_9BILA